MPRIGVPRILRLMRVTTLNVDSVSVGGLIKSDIYGRSITYIDY